MLNITSFNIPSPEVWIIVFPEFINLNDISGLINARFVTTSSMYPCFCIILF